ncbi:MAG: hypothetical protein QNJ55_34005 [Xenococcus sp. MO_188.B8]|nr:hypothetical protein [Xenococcus sp. MO_188.B8]
MGIRKTVTSYNDSGTAEFPTLTSQWNRLTMKLSDYNQMPTVAALMKSFPYFAQPDDTVAQIVNLR